MRLACATLLVSAPLLAVLLPAPVRAAPIEALVDKADKLTSERRWLEAAEQYEALLIDPALQKKPKLRQQIQGKLAVVILELGMLQIKGPKGAKVTLDGKPIGELPLEPVRTMPGEHVLLAEQPGFAPQEQKVMVESGVTTPIHVKLELPAVTEVEPPLPSPPVQEQAQSEVQLETSNSSESSLWWLWTTIGVVVAAGVAAGVAVGVTRQDQFVPDTELGISRFDEWSAP